MIARIRTSMEEKDRGFTLIELLVVMIIIGILAAIAIPVFLSQRQKARETAAKADVSVVGKEVAAYYVDGNAGLTASSDAPGGTWSLAVGASSTAFASGALSPTVKVVSTDIVSSTDYCVAMQSGHTGASSTSTDAVWRFTNTGLVKGGAC